MAILTRIRAAIMERRWLRTYSREVLADPTLEPWLEETRRQSEDGTFDKRYEQQTPIEEKIKEVQREGLS